MFEAGDRKGTPIFHWRKLPDEQLHVSFTDGATALVMAPSCRAVDIVYGKASPCSHQPRLPLRLAALEPKASVPSSGQATPKFEVGNIRSGDRYQNENSILGRLVRRSTRYPSTDRPTPDDLGNICKAG